MASGCVFEKVIIIGYGQIVNQCILKLNELKTVYGYSLTYVEYEKTELSTSVDLCEKEGIDYTEISDKSALTSYFLEKTEKTLIISAGNFYIFPESVVEKENFTIINFHSALLPKYPGRNAQSWAIFMEEKEAGATWHFVTKELDAGKYIIQKPCEITEDTKAYELTGQIMNEAYEGFAEIIDGVLTDRYEKVQDKPVDKNRRVYKGKDVPGNGVFNIEDGAEYIYRLLRSTDYGKSDIFPPICTILNGNKVRISNYKRIPNEGISEITVDERTIYIPFDENSTLRLRYKSL